jgi:hypothetical protein
MFHRLDWDRWLMMGFIGFAVGLIGFLLHQLIDVIAEWKWEKANHFIKVMNRFSLLVAPISNFRRVQWLKLGSGCLAIALFLS